MKPEYKKIFIAVSLIILSVLVLVLFLRGKKPPKPSSTRPVQSLLSPKPETPVLSDIKPSYQVGKVMVTKDEILREYNYIKADIINTPDEPKKALENAADKLTRDAIILDEGAKSGLFTLTDNSPIDYEKVNIATEYFEKEGTNYISGEMISVWFYNMNPPGIGIEKAKEITYKYISDLKMRLVKGSISMEQAGKMISANTSLATIDPAYQRNSYDKFEFHKLNKEKFFDQNMDNTLKNMNKGDISPVLIGKDFDGTNWYDAYYMVIKVNDKKTDGFNSVDELVNSRIEEGNKITL